MNILVTNDDGILAPGLALLADVCREVGTVTVVAPDREQSGTSHSLTLHRPLRPARRPDGAWQIDGTPTDCVMLALQALMPERGFRCFPFFSGSGLMTPPFAATLRAQSTRERHRIELGSRKQALPSRRRGGKHPS